MGYIYIKLHYSVLSDEYVAKPVVINWMVVLLDFLCVLGATTATRLEGVIFDEATVHN